ncbi:MAG: GatB/YqeY domain-containing protein [Patescibacteria group bacterium]
MLLHETIQTKMKEAMIKKDAVRLSVLRGLLASFMNELVAKKITGPHLSDDDALALIKRAVKQRKDSIDQFGKGGRQDLVDAEKAELTILEAFLPQMMSYEEVLKIAKVRQAELGMKDKTAVGKFTGMLMKEFKGKADGMVVKEAVESLFK